MDETFQVLFLNSVAKYSIQLPRSVSLDLQPSNKAQRCLYRIVVRSTVEPLEFDGCIHV